jgi:TRAP-type C4-dicarboxylate transport system substrate-binding protein
MLKIQRRKLLAGFALSPVAGRAFAQEARLTFATTMPLGPAGAASNEFLNPWIEQIEKEGKGVVAVTRRDGPNIATMANSYDRVMNDVVQIAWSLQPLLGGKFPLSEVAGLPFLTKSSEAASVALWRLYKTGILDSEYQDVVPLWFAVSAQNQMHFAKPLKSMLELDGLKVNVFNRTLVQVVETFKGTPVSVGPEQVYESLQRGNADGTMTSWTGFRAYRLTEVTKFHVSAPFGSSVHMFFMSKKKFNELTPQARKVLMDASGEVQARRHGVAWDRREGLERAEAEATGKHTVVDASTDQVKAWTTQTQPIIEAWAKGRPNGQKVLDTYKQLLDQVESERKQSK